MAEGPQKPSTNVRMFACLQPVGTGLCRHTQQLHAANRYARARFCRTAQLFPANGNGLIHAIAPGIKSNQYCGWCSENLFVLDYFPYHSAKFYDKGADCLKQNYWGFLAKHGLTNKKLMVFWGSKILNRVKKDYPEEFDAAAKEERIAILRGQKAVFSDWNFVFATDKCGARIKEFVKGKGIGE